MSGVTERDMFDALHTRYDHRYGNGQRYVIAEHVRSHGSFYARRTADMVVIDCWQTGKYSLHGHEVKTSRSDWLRELKSPDKAAEFIPYMNRWWLVVADESIVKDGELPAGWGLMVLREGRIVTVRNAKHRDALPLEPGQLASLGRAVAKTAAARAYRDGYQGGIVRAARDAREAAS